MAAPTKMKFLPVAIVAALAAVTLAAAKGCDDGRGAAQNSGKSTEPTKKDTKPATTDKDSKTPTKDPKADPAKPAAPETLPITINGKTFKLELAVEEAVRMKGLGQRAEIASDGGMLFGFADAQRRGFVMRDCPVDIDIIYLDGSGRVLSWYTMKAEKPRGEGEGAVGDFNNQKYEGRLPQYPSRFPTQFVIELKGGTIPSLNLKEGQRIEADWPALKKRSK